MSTLPTVLITGASTGIGATYAERFAQRGHDLVLVARDGSRLEALATRLRTQHHIAVDLLPADLTQQADLVSVEARLRDDARIGILINNAGITRDALTRKMTDEQWDLVVDVDLKGVFNLTRYVGPHMEETGGGSIVSISSVVGEFGNIGQANYAAAKAGVIGLTKTWAKEFARKGVPVRVNCITPGYTMTDILKTVPQDLLDKFAKMTMLGRLGQPEEIAKAALFLASDDASYVTGHVLSVNGGMRL